MFRKDNSISNANINPNINKRKREVDTLDTPDTKRQLIDLTHEHPYVITTTPGLQNAPQQAYTMDDFKHLKQTPRKGNHYYFQDGAKLTEDVLTKLVHFGSGRSAKSYLNVDGNLTQVFTQSKLSHEQCLVFKNGDSVPKNAKVIQENHQRYVLTVEGNEKIPVWPADAHLHQQKRDLRCPVTATVVAGVGDVATKKTTASHYPLSFFYAPPASTATPAAIATKAEDKQPESLPPLSSVLRNAK